MHGVRRRVFRSIASVVALIAAPVALLGVTATPAGAVDVTTSAQYLAAYGNAAVTSIRLLNDITFSPCPAFASRISGNALTVDGQGHTINGCPATLNHSTIGDVNFVDVTLNGGTLVVSIIGNVTLTNTTVRSTDISVLGLSIIGNVTIDRSTIGPLSATTASVLAASIIGNVSIDRSTLGPFDATTSVLGLSVSGPLEVTSSTAGPMSGTTILGVSSSGPSLSFVDSMMAGLTGTGPVTGLSFANTTTTINRSTIANVAGAGPDFGIAGVSQATTVVNSTVSNNGGPASIIGSFSSVYSDFVENGGVAITAPTSAESIELPPLPDEAPDGMRLAEPVVAQAALDQVGAQQVDAQLFFDEGSFFGSVVALPQGGAVNCDITGTVTSSGYNFSDDDTCGFTGTGDRENAGDPMLGALADNGGPTLTRLPLAGSPLLNWIPIAACQVDGAAGVTTDQRSLPRPAETGCEVGSVEVQPEPLVVRFTG